MGSIGITELVIIFLIIVVLFGARRIPELMRGLGSGIREFKKAAQLDEDDAAAKSASVQPSPPASLPESGSTSAVSDQSQSRSNV